MLATDFAFDEFTALLATRLDLDLSHATPESDLRDDLGLDSLSFAELLIVLDDYDVVLPDELIPELRTMADIHHYFNSLRPRPIAAEVVAGIVAEGADVITDPNASTTTAAVR